MQCDLDLVMSFTVALYNEASLVAGISELKLLNFKLFEISPESLNPWSDPQGTYRSSILQDSDTSHFRQVRSAFNGLAVYKRDAIGADRSGVLGFVGFRASRFKGLSWLSVGVLCCVGS